MNPVDCNIYKCTNCSNCYLCENCHTFKDDLHTPNHYFIKYENSYQIKENDNKNDNIINKP